MNKSDTNTMPHWYKPKAPMESGTNNTVIGVLCGILGGMWKYFLQIPPETSFLMKLGEAGLMALVCGALGAAGKYLFDYALKPLFKKSVSKSK